MPILIKALSPVAGNSKKAASDFIIPLISTGDGSGIAILTLISAESTIATIRGGFFYSDSVGSNPTISISIPSNTAKEMYIGVSTGSGDITISNGSLFITHINSWQSTENCPSINQLTFASLPGVLEQFMCAGNNTILGSLKDLPSTVTCFQLCGNTDVSYTRNQPASFSNNMNYFDFSPDSSKNFSSNELDDLITDLSLLSWRGDDRTLILLGTNPARTSASDTAVYDLMAKQVNVAVLS